MANLANFSFTKQADVFSAETVLPGTAVNLKSGSKDEGTYLEGNGIVLAASPLSLEISLYNLFTNEFEDVSVGVTDFVNNLVELSVLTIEDGTGTELTGAIPSDMFPPAEVDMLEGVPTHDSVTFTYNLPLDEDFNHVEVMQDGVVIDNNVTAEEFTVTGLDELSTYNFVFRTVDDSGNKSDGVEFIVVTEQAPDLTPPGEVENLTATNLTSDSADLFYDMPTDEDLSHVQVFDGVTLVEDNVIDTTYALTGLTASTEYTYTVKTVDVSGNVSAGTSVTFTTLA